MFQRFRTQQQRGSRNFGETLEVSCAEGFIGESSYLDTPTWTCGGDGNWNGEGCVPTVKYCNSIEGTYKIPEGAGRQVRCNSNETTKYKGNTLTCTDAVSDTTDINQFVKSIQSQHQKHHYLTKNMP